MQSNFSGDSLIDTVKRVMVPELDRPEPVDILDASAEHGERVIEILGNAFKADPAVTWVCQEPAFPDFMFRLLLPYYYTHGHVNISRDGNGAALWLPPGTTPSPLEGFRLLLTVFRAYGCAAALRFLKVGLAMDKYHYKPPHYYLFAIGVTADAKGKGVGSALLRKGLARADDEKVPVYLENSNEANLDVYLHFGFETEREVKISKGPRLWPMLRIPRSARSEID